MGPSLLVAADDPRAVVAGAAERWRVIVWPDDGPRLVATHWDRIGPGLDAVTEQTGAGRLSAEEAAALPGVRTLAGMLALRSRDGEAARLLVGDPGSVAAFVVAVSSLGYAQQRVLPMPLDLLAMLNRSMRRLAAAGAPLSVATELVQDLHEHERWAGSVLAEGRGGRRAGVHLALAGVPMLSDATDVRAAIESGRPVVLDTSPLLQVRGEPDEPELLIGCPGLRKGELELARAGDHLLVTAYGVVHPIALPAAAKRCRITGAGVHPDGIVVRLQPQEGMWRE